ncbi:hypothetical protein DY000_02015826 [Brassica cretica]|uniref:Uncharacterized protein n=1 Tax=Brassica cretica TaxID=69181 RepID=A0ABQ7CYI6_BRACR|nr:hypothetical protein DY000_02015826 [Brassica cretica]
MGIIGEGGARAPLGSLDCVLGPGGPCQTTRSFILDPEVFSLGPGTETGARGRIRVQGCSLDPEIVSGPLCTRILRSCGNPEASEVVLEPRGLDPEIVVWNPEEPRGSSLDPEIFDWNPEAIGEPRGTVLCLPMQDYYRYLFGFCILPLGIWPISSSYVVFYFCRKSLTCLKGAGVGVVTQVPGLRCFPRLEKQDLDCSLCFTVLLQ